MPETTSSLAALPLRPPPTTSMLSSSRRRPSKLFGAVTSQEICDALKEQFGIEIEKNKIVQADPIKTFGSYQVKAKLGYEVSGTVNVLVIEA